MASSMGEPSRRAQRRAERTLTHQTAKQDKQAAYDELREAKRTLRARRKDYRGAKWRLRRFMLRPLAWVVVALVALVVIGNILADSPTDTTAGQQAAVTTATTAAPATTTTKPPATTTTRQTTTTTRPTTTTTISEAEIAQLAFDVVVATHPVLSGYDLDWLHEVAGATCEAFDAGVGFEVVALAVYAESPADWDADTTGEFIGAATAAFCPEYAWMLEEAADTWG